MNKEFTKLPVTIDTKLAGDAYDAVFKIIEPWINSAPYQRMKILVSLMIGDFRENTVLELSTDDYDTWIWDDDWWEGERFITVYGAMDLEEVDFEGYVE